MLKCLRKDPDMNTTEALTKIKEAIEKAPRNSYTAELHLQIIKYADLLQNVSGREFCESLKLTLPYGTEYAKMKKIAPRLVSAGLKVERI
jgi:hypothetical protein